MERLKRRADFRAASSASRISAGGFVLQARSRGDARGVRVGFTVSKQVGNAVERNRVRRRLREIVRLSTDAAMHDGHDYVLIGRRTALTCPFGDMTRELDGALRRVATGAGNKPPLHKAGSRAQPARDRQQHGKPPRER